MTSHGGDQVVIRNPYFVNRYLLYVPDTVLGTICIHMEMELPLRHFPGEIKNQDGVETRICVSSIDKGLLDSKQLIRSPRGASRAEDKGSNGRVLGKSKI